MEPHTDGRRLLTTSLDGTVRLWDLAGDADPIVLGTHPGRVWRAAFDPRGRRVVTPSEDHTAGVWPIDGRGEPIVLRGDRHWVMDVRFSPDGDRTVTASRDGTVRVWSSDGHGEPIVLEGHTSWVFRAVFSPNGRHVLSSRAQNGGAVYTSAEFITPHDSQVRLEQCSLIDNQVVQNGGAILLNSLTHVELLDTTLSGNLAGSGGRIFNDGGGLYEIRGSTIARNHASNIGGGISEVHFNPDLILVSNSIIAGNTADFSGPDCNLRLRSEGATLIGDTASCQPTTASGDLLDVDPQLGPLTQLAPRIWAHRPRPGSPVIDSGADKLCTPADQTNNPRPQDGDGDGESRCDLGAIELGVPIFAAGFETGDTSEWSTAVP